jgi:hypothetical protein
MVFPFSNNDDKNQLSIDKKIIIVFVVSLISEYLDNDFTFNFDKTTEFGLEEIIREYF